MFDADKFGFYTVGDRKTYSKYEAIQWQKSTGLFPEWNFNKVIYGLYCLLIKLIIIY